ncbi:MAG: hypothetical protein FJ037_05370 [Chloroflexi bacterium]|nr:hypothetical protein [Chloroflexota bacterium]
MKTSLPASPTMQSVPPLPFRVLPAPLARMSSFELLPLTPMRNTVRPAAMLEHAAGASVEAVIAAVVLDARPAVTVFDALDANPPEAETTSSRATTGSTSSRFMG